MTDTQDQPADVEEQDDGSALVTLPEEDEAPKPEGGFYDNLAESLSSFELRTLASDLLDLIEKDQKAREKRDEQYAEGIKRTGLGDDAPGGATFEGASKVVHPVLAEGCVDFAARAMKELFPANGPVKTKILGEANEAKLQKARQKRDFLNWLLTDKIEEYRPNKETLLTQLPLGGSQYEKFYPDFTKGRIAMDFVPVDKLLLPYSADSFYTAPRMTEIQDITRDTYEERVASGFYIDTDLLTASMPDTSKAEEASNKIEGVTDADLYNEDGLRRIFECTCWWRLGPKDGDEPPPLSPYIIHLDDATQKVIAVYRNWQQEDEKEKKLDWLVEDKFITWRGALGIGLPHLIGGMAGALTGGIRALLDAAHIANTQAAVKLKGSRTSGGNVQVNPTEIAEIDAPPGVDDIRKVMMPLPYPGPSTVLFQLIDWLQTQAKGVVATAEEKIADASNQMPVGTALALIEQGSQVYCSIHSRLHDSQRRAFKIIARILVQYPELHAEDMQRFGLTPQDFSDLDGIEPVSDPNIFSEAQRFAQFQAAMQLGQQLAQSGVQVNFGVLGRRGYELLRVDGIDEFLPKPPQPVSADPITENMAATQGQPLKSQPQQDHVAHIYAHVGFVLNPIHTMSQLPDPSLMAILQHVHEHLNQFYQVTAQMIQRKMMPRVQQAAQQGQMMSPDQVAMRSAQQAQQYIAKLLQDVMPMMQQAEQIAQKKQPPSNQPMDPALASYQAAMAETNRRAQLDQIQHTEKMAELQQTSQENQQKLQTAFQELRTALQGQQMDAANDLRTTLLELAQKTDQQEKDREVAWAEVMAKVDAAAADQAARLGELQAQREADVVGPIQQLMQQFQGFFKKDGP